MTTPHETETKHVPPSVPPKDEKKDEKKDKKNPLDYDFKASTDRLTELMKDKNGKIRSQGEIGLGEEYWAALAKHRAAYQNGNYDPPAPKKIEEAKPEEKNETKHEAKK